MVVQGLGWFRMGLGIGFECCLDVHAYPRLLVLPLVLDWHPSWDSRVRHGPLGAGSRV